MDKAYAASRIIVALDGPTADEALALVEELEGVVSFFQVGHELLLACGLGALLRKLSRTRVFVDLKLPDDVAETIQRVVGLASDNGVRFLSLSHSIAAPTIRAAVEGRRGPNPELLWVPFVSRLDETLVLRAQMVKDMGVNGFLVSGPEIALLRAEFPTMTGELHSTLSRA